MPLPISEYLFPTRCFLCRRISGGNALCDDCQKQWDACITEEYGSDVYPFPCMDRLCYLSHYSVSASHPVSAYLRRAKRDYRKIAVAFAASEGRKRLQSTVAAVWKDLIVVPVPRSRQAVRRFGFDQSQYLAQALAKELNGRYLPILEHNGNTLQKMLPRQQRMENALKAYRVRSGDAVFICGKQVLLVDDVVTTGATLSACARLLCDAGANSVMGFAMARTFKNE